MPDRDPINPTSMDVARLLERVTAINGAVGDVNQSIHEMRGQLQQMSQTMTEVANLRKDLAETNQKFDGKTQRLFDKTEKNEKALSDLDRLTNDRFQALAVRFAFGDKAWKIIGGMSGVILASLLALVGWLYTRVEHTNNIDDRLKTLEIWSQSPPAIAVPPLPPVHPLKGR